MPADPKNVRSPAQTGSPCSGQTGANDPKTDDGSRCVTFVKERFERIQYLQRD
jgi:hypothetical protein